MLQSDIPALSIFKQHRGVVEDVAWHHTSPNTFGSVGDDKLALLWDKRASGELPNAGLLVDCQHLLRFASSTCRWLVLAWTCALFQAHLTPCAICRVLDASERAVPFLCCMQLGLQLSKETWA